MKQLSSVVIILALLTGGSQPSFCEEALQDQEQAISYFEKELAFTVTPRSAKAVVDGERKDVTVIDVRSAEDFAKGHIPGAINIPCEKYNNFEKENQAFEGLRRDHIHYVYCYELLCNLGQKAALAFARQGYAVKEMKGGFKSWEDHGYPVEK
jgi:rhodanese-related sulfurtransferase